MQIDRISGFNNNSTKQQSFQGLGTRPIERTNKYMSTTIYPNINLMIQSWKKNGECVRIARNYETGELISKSIDGGFISQDSLGRYHYEVDPKTFEIKRYFNIHTNPKTDRGLFYDSKRNVIGDLYLKDGSSYRFEPKKTTLKERIKAAKQENSVIGFINVLLGKKAQTICTKFDSNSRPVGSTEFSPLTIEDILRMYNDGELEQLCK